MGPALPLSLEFFPPRTPEGAAKLAATRRELYALQPQWCSVTYGAGGTTQEGTLQTVQDILAEGVGAAPHFSCIGATRSSVRQKLAAFRAAGIERVVALRGDLPADSGNATGDFRHASDLVAFMRQESGDAFTIAVAAYPEQHPQAASPQADLDAFVTKARAGADVAITQFFYNADAYFRFVDEVRKQGVDIPVVPGIMPITNAPGLMRFADACGTEIPRWMRLRLQAYGDDTASIKAFGLDVVTALCERLRAGGAPCFHIYTMNQAGATMALSRQLH